MDSINSSAWEDSVENAHGIWPSTDKSTPVSTSNDVSVSSLKKRKRLVQKRVISVPISHLDSSKQKGETPPPLDGWTWRKYGQKPIKGSPYPRGYYRCSSSKGCPARKQVERSRFDPTVLLVTYACDHNHISPTRNPPAASPDAVDEKSSPEEPKKTPPEPEFEEAEKLEMDCGELVWDDASWFSNIGEPTILPEAFEMDVGELRWLKMDGGAAEDIGGCNGEVEICDDESLFADLCELPESSVVFRRGGVLEEESRRCSALRTDTVG